MKPDGVFIELMVGGHWRDDTAAGAFEYERDAVAYLQEHLDRYATCPNCYLRIRTRLFEVRPDGLYVMTNRQGWQVYEGVQS